MSYEAIRRTENPIHPIDDYFRNTFGVMELCGEDCVQILDKSGMAQADGMMLGDFARFFLNAKLAEYRQVAFQAEQSKSVETTTGDVAATAKEGDIKRDWSDVCLPEYDETGKSRICVKVLPPRNPIWIGVRSLVKPTEGPGSLVKLAFRRRRGYRGRTGGPEGTVWRPNSRKWPTRFPLWRGESVSDVYFINTLMKAINKFDDKTIGESMNPGVRMIGVKSLRATALGLALLARCPGRHRRRSTTAIRCA